MSQITIYSALAAGWISEDDPRCPFTVSSWEGEFEGDLEDVFEAFNVVTKGDVIRLQSIGYELPSLSVGDIVTLDGVDNLCCPVGWKEIGPDEVESIKADPTNACRLARSIGA